VDGSPLGVGKTVRVGVTVWASAAWATEAVDVYRAPDANSPAWTYVGTRAPASPGAQVLSVTFALPPGARQAVRAHYRTGGSAAACGKGTTDDHDDLAFAVGP
jgi:hypothetical protein